MKQSERYLRRATRGLWGERKRALRAELQGHIDERVLDFRLGGLSDEEAEARTLRELGVPQRVSGGMLRVHTLPALGRAGALSLLLVTALLGVVTQSAAQVKSIYGNVSNMGATGYLDFEQFRAALEEAGGKVDGRSGDAAVTVPGAPRPAYPLHAGGWPGATLIQGGRTYLQTDALIGVLLNSGADVQLSGWKNPTLQAGTSAITIQTDDWRVLNGLYLRTLIASGPELNAGTLLMSLEPLGNTGTVEFAGKLKTAGIYALVTPVFSDWSSRGPDGKLIDSGNIILKSNISPAGSGRVQFRLDNEARTFRLFSSVSAFQAALDPYRDVTKLHGWSAQHPAPALLLKLSGKFGRDAYTVVDPRSVRLGK